LLINCWGPTPNYWKCMLCPTFTIINLLLIVLYIYILVHLNDYSWGYTAEIGVKGRPLVRLFLDPCCQKTWTWTRKQKTWTNLHFTPQWHVGATSSPVLVSFSSSLPIWQAKSCTWFDFFFLLQYSLALYLFVNFPYSLYIFFWIIILINQRAPLCTKDNKLLDPRTLWPFFTIPVNICDFLN